jgi:formate/nitrite transporter FocA (FNT family)
MQGYLYNLGIVGLGNLVGGAVIVGWSYWIAGREQS